MNDNDSTLATRLAMLEHVVALLVRASPNAQQIVELHAEFAAGAAQTGAGVDAFPLQDMLSKMDFTAARTP